MSSIKSTAAFACTAKICSALSKQTLPEPHYATIHMHDSVNKHAISYEFIPKRSLQIKMHLGVNLLSEWGFSASVSLSSMKASRLW